MAEIFFRAKLVLEEVHEVPDDRGYPRERTNTIADVAVTGGSPNAAMTQICEHAVQLKTWHREGEDLRGVTWHPNVPAAEPSVSGAKAADHG